MPSNGTQYDDDDDDEFDGIEDSNLVKQLRKQLKQEKTRNDSLENQLREVSGRDRQRTLTEALTAKGLNPKAAKFYPGDSEVTDEAITAWLGDNADLFGVPTDDTTATGPGEGNSSATTEQPAETSVVNPTTSQAFLRMQAASLAGPAATTGEADALRQIQQADSPEALEAFLRSARA